MATTTTPDITIDELIAALPSYDNDIKAWWQGAAALPASTTVNEFFIKTLSAANVAAATKNAGLSAGSKIAGYPSPSNGAIATASDGSMSFVRTCSVVSRVTVNLDVANTPLA